LRSICGRTDSSSLSYCTPDGHAVTQAMQPRHCVDVLGERAVQPISPFDARSIR
jgi:hypothetical protein